MVRLCFILILLMSSMVIWGQEPLNVETRIAVIPIEQIDTGVSAYLKRAIRSALTNKASVIVFEINIEESSDVLAVLEMVGHIDQLRKRDENLRVVALVKNAQSLGVFLVFACNRIYLTEDAEIGQGTAGVSYASSPNFIKAFSDELSRVALENNHNSDLAMAMVDPEIELKEITVGGNMAVLSTEKVRQMQENPSIGEVVEVSTIVAKGSVLNLNAGQAEKYGLSETVRDEKELFKKMNIAKPSVYYDSVTWSERMVSWLTTWYISALLLAVGFICLWIEFKMPGFGVFGVVGIICLSILFVSKYMAGLAQVYEIMLIFIGVILIACEFFVFPGTWVCGVLGILCLGSGMVLSFQHYVFPNPSKPWEVNDFVNNISAVLVSLSVTMAGFFGLLQLLQNNKTFQRRFVILDTSPDGGLHSQKVTADTSLLGKQGVCVTELRPAGRIEILDKFYDVVSTGDFINRGDRVSIIDVSSNRIMVEKIED